MAHRGALFSEGTQAATYPAGQQAMAYYRLAASLALMVVLIARASGNSTEIPQRLEFNASDVRASDVFDTLKEGTQTVIGHAKSFTAGIIAASTVPPILAIICMICCCLWCCGACSEEEKQAPQTVIYTVRS